MKLSIIIPTLNRFADLKRCVESVRHYAPNFEHEIIVIDGGSDDGTKEWLYQQDDLLIIQHNRRRGCNKAFNDGFAVAVGEYCAQLSDDVEVVNDCLAAAVYLIEQNPRAGQVMIPHIESAGTECYPRFTTNKGSFPFVPFGITPRALGESVGWWGDYYHVMGDAELSLKIMDAGYDIIRLEGMPIRHYPGASDMRKHKSDLALFAKRWSEWGKE